MQHFAPQLHPQQQSTVSLRASQYRKKLKPNQHDQDHHGHDHSSSSDSDAHNYKSRAPPSNAPSLPSFASPELAQLRVAGLVPEQEHKLPPSPFPHAPARVSNPYLGAAKIRKELAGPPSRLYAANNNSTSSQADTATSQTEASNLRRTHLNVLSTVMHRCLQLHDYHRAGRAWGMILRTQATHGNTVDLRNHGRWGIGAEILLRRNPRRAATDRDAPDTDVNVFSEQGFELAREYYERLIVQHPTRKQAPHAVDQRSFYPAMFSLWIQEVNEKSRRARERISEDAVQVEELAGALEIAERLDDLVRSPPFDKQASLLELRGNIALWISDLIVGNTSATPMDEWDPYPISNHLSRTEQMAKFNRCQRELNTAEAYLSRVEENGGLPQHQQVQKIEMRLKELRKQITKLETGEDDTNVSMDDSW